MSRIQDFETHADVMRVLLWQYNTAERLQKLLEFKQAWYDQNQQSFWDDWYRDVFDLRTANDFGLTVWAIILDLPLGITGETPSLDRPIFGFGIFNQNFENGNFYGLFNPIINLSREQKRLILRLRYFQLVTNGTVPQINAFLKYLFTDGRVYVIDNLDMTCTYVFTYEPPRQVMFALQSFDVLPRPAAVGVNIITPSTREFSWDVEDDTHGGFDEASWVD